MDIYKTVTDKIIEQMERGVIPWRKPWASCLDGAYNRVSKKPYSLLNQLLLDREGEYATFRQWEQAGGTIKRGEKSQIIVFWKMSAVEEETETGEKKIKYIPVLRYFNVFHSSQVSGVEPLERTKHFDTEPIEEADRAFWSYVDREKIHVQVGESNRAFYRRTDDVISLPALFQFESAEEFYSTAYHEAGHSTMLKHRCDREDENRKTFFGSEDYSKEELTAELTSAYIMNSLRLETPNTLRNSAAYIQSWLKVLRGDKKLIVSSSSRAEKATRYILQM